MSTHDELDPEFTRSVISHMNEDHADACLRIVRAFSDERSASSARLHKLDRHSLYFLVQNSTSAETSSASGSFEVRVDLPKPLRSEQQLRGAIVGLSSQARKILSADE